MARADIAALLASKTKDEAEKLAEQPTAPAPARTMKAAPKASAPERGAKAPQAATGSAEEARTLDRKGAVLFLDQSVDLDIHARRLNKAKSLAGTPRITANTLLRIAADLLLARAAELKGDSENELRQSVGLDAQPNKTHDSEN